MKKRLLLGFATAVMMVMPALSEEVIVNIRPPAPIHETIVARPGPGYVWTPGYYRWDGGHHVWVAGAWVMPPHPGARWVAHRWVRRGNGWVFVEGRWR
jgi:hypothetical protein